MTRRKSKTAAELMAELNADPSFVARQHEQEQAHAKMVAGLRREAEPMINALKEVGVDVNSVRDLTKGGFSYPKAVPVLIDHLQRPYSARLREGIARALAVPEAIAVWESLLRLFEAETESTPIDVKWAIGCAIAAAANDNVIGDVIRLLHDRRHGPQRIAFISALARSADPRALDAMSAASTDPELALEIEKTLKRRWSKKAIEKAAGATGGDLVEVSTNLDASQVGLFLGRVAGLVRGFDQKEIEEVTRSVGELEVEDECEFSFTVMHSDRSVLMQIYIFMDDEDSTDVYFFTSADLAREIDVVVTEFSEESGM